VVSLPPHPLPPLHAKAECGTEAIIFRNTGGQIKPLLNDFLAIDHLIQFERVLIVHHTDCGTLQFTSDEVRAGLMARDPSAAAAAEINSGHFCGISDIEASVVDDVKILKGSALVREELKDSIQGFVYEIETGRLRAVELD
jgi:carbonic anhydrase